MNLKESKYEKYALVKEMMETVEVVRNFKPSVSEPFMESLRHCSKINWHSLC
jgi:hypothetical protein